MSTTRSAEGCLQTREFGRSCSKLGCPCKKSVTLVDADKVEDRLEHLHSRPIPCSCKKLACACNKNLMEDTEKDKDWLVDVSQPSSSVVVAQLRHKRCSIIATVKKQLRNAARSAVDLQIRLSTNRNFGFCKAVSDGVDYARKHKFFVFFILSIILLIILIMMCFAGTVGAILGLGVCDNSIESHSRWHFSDILLSCMKSKNNNFRGYF